jgi:guanylate kinase
MDFFNKEHGFLYLRNITTRASRLNEYHKMTISEADFLKEKNEGKLILDNIFFNDRYGYLKEDIERAISNINEFFMIDFGLENIDQLKGYKNIHKIILLPNSYEFLIETIKKSDRSHRGDEILENYMQFYAHLQEGKDDTLNAFVVKNKQNDVGTVIFKIFKHLVNTLEIYISGSPLLKSERLKLILENVKLLDPSWSGLQAYKILTNEINKFEDHVWGMGTYNRPQSFLGGHKTDRLYTILTESFFDVNGYSGVTLLLSRQELVFISRYGAIEAQYKDEDDRYGEKIPYQDRIDKVFFRKADGWGDGVWNKKNK